MLTPALDVSWGGYTVTLTAIFGICTMVQWSDEWDFFVNLSASDFPLLPQVWYIHVRKDITFQDVLPRTALCTLVLRERNAFLALCTSMSMPPIIDRFAVDVGSAVHIDVRVHPFLLFLLFLSGATDAL